MKIKGLIFDFGFTLFEFKDATVEKYLNCYKEGLLKSIEVLKKNNYLKSDQDSKSFFDTFNNKRMMYFKEGMKTKKEHRTTEIFRETLNKFMIKDLDQDLFEELADIYHSPEGNEWHPFEKTADTLKKLRTNKELKLAVLSNHPHHSFIEKMLIKFELRKYFDAVVTSAEFGKRKPDPEIFHYTLRKMGINSPDSCLVCGDEYADIVGGHRAGLQTILCKRIYEFPYEKEIVGLDYLKVNDISEILNHFDNLSKE